MYENEIIGLLEESLGVSGKFSTGFHETTDEAKYSKPKLYASALLFYLHIATYNTRVKILYVSTYNVLNK